MASKRAGPTQFKNLKQQILSRLDASRKGSIDSLIQDVVQFINSNDNYVTTSSCSGRILLFCENPANKKKDCKWLFISHDIVKSDEFLKYVDPGEGDLVVKFEPMILHVQCSSLESAKHLHTCALEAGFRNSGITLGKNGKLTLAIRSCLGLEVPISSSGVLLTSEEYLKFIISKANKKMEENKNRIDLLFLKLNMSNKNEKESTSGLQ